MSNVIDFLERLGQDSKLHSAVSEDIEAALRAAGIDPRLQASILDADRRALQELLGADGNVCCMIFKEDEEEEKEDEEEKPEGEEEGEDDEKAELAGDAKLPRLAARATG